MRPRELGYGQAISESTEQDLISARIFLLPLLDWLPACGEHDLCNLVDPDALGDDSSFFTVTQQQRRACVRRMSPCKLTCTFPSSSLDPRSASGAFAVAKEEDRDRFIGDKHTLNSRLEIRDDSNCLRDTKYCSYLYEVPLSRVTKQVIGPRIPRSWLEHLDDEIWDVVDLDEIESGVSQDLLKTCTSVELVSVSD